MAKPMYRRMMLWSLMGVVALLPVLAGAQAIESGELPVLLSTGMPVVESPEDALPLGAIAYVRANNVLMLLDNVDSLLTAFVPEKALPPEMQEIFANPQPFLTLFSMKAFGQAVALNQFAEMFGIAFDRPASLAFYPMPPQQGFLLTLPLSNATVVTGMAQSILAPDAIEQGTLGNVTYYHVSVGNYDLPDDVYIVTSENTAYFCGSMAVLEMLAQTAEIGALQSDPVITKTIEAYNGRDLTITLSPGMFKEQLPGLKDMAVGTVNQGFAQAREGLQQIPPADRLAIDSRLRLELGIDGLDALLNYIEAYATGTSRVLLDQLVTMLTNADGLTLSLNLEPSFQNLALTMFSQDIQPAVGTQAIPLADVASALSSLPGDKGVVVAVGKTAEKAGAPVRDAILAAIAEELSARNLSLTGFQVVKDFYAAQPYQTPLTSQVDWTVQSMVKVVDDVDLSQFKSLDEVLLYVRKQMTGKPLMVPVTLMPAVNAGVIAQHYAGKAEQFTLQGQNYAALRAGLPFNEPLFDVSGQFAQADLGNGLTQLTLDKVYTSRRGLFGFQQHALINRNILLHQHTDTYELLYASGLDAAEVTDAAAAKTTPLPAATVKLFEQIPAGTTHLSTVHLLHLLPKMVKFLVDFEDLTHREFDAFLAQAQEVVTAAGTDDVEKALLDAKLSPPLLLASLNVNADGQVYATLPTGLHYPRPKMMPILAELLTEVSARATAVGGGATFVVARPGALELASVESTEGLALLVKSTVNAFYDRYMATPEGMETLIAALQHPDDFQSPAEEAVFVNPMWQALSEAEDLPWVAAGQRSKRSLTAANMRALGTALGSYQVDMNYFPKHAEVMLVENIDLPDDYYMGETNDAWDQPIVYLSDADGLNYVLISYGKNGLPGYTDSEFDDDLIYMNGQFLAPYMFADYSSNMYENLNTALLMAVSSGAREMAEALLNSGADVNSVNADGKNALQIATELELTDMVELLEYWGATLPEE